MNVSVTDVSPSQKKLRVEIPASRVQEEIEGKYRDLARQAKIKGFRPGKVPRSIIKSYYGKAVEQEVSSQFIQETFPEALKETDLKPLTQADVSDSGFEENGSFAYTALVDVCPPFEMPEYKGIEVYKPPVEVDELLVEAELEKLRQGHAQLRAVESPRPIREGDVAVVDFTPHVEGKVFEKGRTRDYMVEVGKGSLHPDFDKHLLGREPGENVSFELDYPEDAPTRDVAGKRVLFEVEIKELKEKEVPALDDEFAQSLGSTRFDSLEALKETIRAELRKREEQRASSEVHRQLTEKLLRRVEFDISPRVVEREADSMAENLKYQFESQGLQFDPARFETPEFRAGYRDTAEKNIRTRLLLNRIAEVEQIQTTEEDDEEIFREIAMAYRMDPAKVKREFADSALVEQAKNRKLEEKVLRFMEEQAVFLDKPEEPEESQETGSAEAVANPEQE